MLGVFGDGADEFGADVLALPPHHLVGPVPRELIAVEQQHEFIDDVDAVELQANAFGRDVGDETIARRLSSTSVELIMLASSCGYGLREWR
jgi:hypothetical protein